MGDDRKPCPGEGTCCTRPLFDRTMFPCDQTAALWRRVLILEAELARVRADLDVSPPPPAPEPAR